MSGQRRDRQVRADRRDDFGEIKQAYKTANSGRGCWENIKSCLSLIVLITICGIITSILSGNASAQSSQDSCYPHSTGYNNINTLIWANPGYAEEKLGYLPIHSSFSVNESSEDASGNCWLRIDQGWIRDLHVLASKDDKPLPPSPTLNVARNIETEEEIDISSRCYTSSNVYITGSMNIRSGPSTNNSKSGIAESGQFFPAQDAIQGDTYCWIKISEGWIAHTAYVTSDITKVLPPIGGMNSHQERDVIVRAFEYLIGKSPEWFNYFIEANISKITVTNAMDYDTEGAAIYYTRSRDLQVSSDGLRKHGYAKANVSSTFIHEACHAYQWDRGDRIVLFDFAGKSRLERECYRIEADALSDIDRRNREIPKIRCWARHYDHFTGRHKWACD